MSYKKDLYRIALRFRSRSIAYTNSFDNRKNTDNERSYCVISLYGAWEDFCYGLVVHSALHKPYRGIPQNGVQRLRVACSTTNNMLSIDSGRLQHLGNPYKITDACNAFSLSNSQTIKDAMISEGSPANDLRYVRNYLAHRNRDTAVKCTNNVHSLTITSNELDLPFILQWLSDLQLGGRTRLRKWADDLFDVACAAIQ